MLFFQPTISPLCYGHFVFFFFLNSLNQPGGEMTGYQGFQLVSSWCFDWEVVAYEIWCRMMNV